MSYYNCSYFIVRRVLIAPILKHGLKITFKPKCFNSFNSMNIVHFSSRRPPSNQRYRRILKFLGIGFGLGAVMSGVYLYNTYKKVNTAILNATANSEYILQEAPPKHSIARSIQNLDDSTGLKITLYQFQTCPFCCKVRTFLDYYGFSYDVVEVNSVTHKQTKWTSYRKVPFLVIEQQNTETILQLKDSSMIISALQSFICNKTSSLEEIVKGYPIICSADEQGNKMADIMNKYSLMCGDESLDKSKAEIILERKWRKWVDDVYVHTLSPNVYRTVDESFQAFNWFSKAGDWEEHFKTWERLLVIYVGSMAMYLIGKRLKKKYSLKDDVRVSFYDETNIWLKAVNSKGDKFLGGSEPGLADLGVYGVLTAIEGCEAFQDLLSHTHVLTWFQNMKDSVDHHQGAKYLARRNK